MKRKICALILVAMFFSLCACGKEEVKPQGTPDTTQTENAEPVYYEGHGIKMEIPAVWQDTFVSYFKEFGEGENAFTTLDFMTVIQGDEAGVMTIASFSEESWLQVVKATPEAEDMKIGTSKDGKTYYTVRIDETKFENEENQAKFDAIVKAAKECKKTIEITE